MSDKTRVVDVHNIQGSIWPRLPRYYESFLFFHITKPGDFKKHLKSLADADLITTGAKCEEHFQEIGELKEAQPRKVVAEGHRKEFEAINISFSYKGVEKLVASEEENLRGGLYKKGMFNDLVYEGADDPEHLLPEFKPPPRLKGEPIDEEETWRHHGVLIVAGQSEEALKNKIAEVETAFHVRDASASSIKITVRKHGHLRPEANCGKEHFGFEDHISQPMIKGLDPDPEIGEPTAVPPGYIFTGHKGDPMKQPEWTKEGSFLVFRQLDQKVPEFTKFVNTAAEGFKNYEGNGPKLAAHMMGRWPSGAPVQITPKADNPDYAFVNKFDYPKDDITGCPFAAHTRKMRPRGDVKEDDDDEDDASVILRRGITFGPELTESEKEKQVSEEQRGIYFLCYQSDIRDGFNLIMTRWASNHYFPERKKRTHGEGPGVDPFINQRLRKDHPEGHISLFDGEKEDETKKLDLGVSEWVDQKGGEYFFTPPIKALKGFLVE